MNVLSLLILIFFIYSILGVFLFNNIPFNDIIDSHTNFNNFSSAMVTLFRISTGEDWHLIMHQCIVSKGMIESSLYFISFVTLTSLIMLNLFVMVIIQFYEDF